MIFSNPFRLPAILVWLSFPALSHAQETQKEPVQAEAKQDLFKQVLGYWVVDVDSAETKAFVAEMIKQGAPAEVQKEMEASTFEFKEGQMLMYVAGGASDIKITVKSQDLEKQIIVTDFHEDDEPTLTTLKINGNLLVLNSKDPEDKDVSLGLKRIDEAAFKKRVPEPKVEQPEEKEKEKEPVELKDGYPVAKAVPDKPGFVYSPYGNHVLDVRDLPSGTLVTDPYFQSKEKKMFRVP